jgi:hypothetical protein
MRYRNDVQYKPKTDGSGKATIKFCVTVDTETPFETMDALAALGYPGSYMDISFKKCTAKGRKPLTPMIPLIEQAK